MFALLQLYSSDVFIDEDDCGVNVIAIDVSRERLEQFAADYEQRYRTALKELEAWTGINSECSNEAYTDKDEELEDKHSVAGGLFPETHWHIVEIWDGQREPGDEQASPTRGRTTLDEKMAA